MIFHFCVFLLTLLLQWSEKIAIDVAVVVVMVSACLCNFPFGLDDENHVVVMVVVVLAWSVSACFSYHGSLNAANKTRQHKARHILDYDDCDNNNGMKNRVSYQTMNQNYDIFSFYFDRKVM